MSRKPDEPFLVLDNHFPAAGSGVYQAIFDIIMPEMKLLSRGKLEEARKKEDDEICKLVPQTVKIEVFSVALNSGFLQR